MLPVFFFLGLECYRLHTYSYQISKCKALAKEDILAQSVEMQTYMQFILVRDSNKEGDV